MWILINPQSVNWTQPIYNPQPLQTKLPIHYKLQWHQFSFNYLSFLLLLFTSPFSCAIHADHPLHKIYFSQKQQADKLVRSLNLFPKDSINIATHDPSFVAPKMVEKSFRIPSLNYSGHSVEDLGHHLFRLTHSLWRIYIYIYTFFFGKQKSIREKGVNL